MSFFLVWGRGLKVWKWILTFSCSQFNEFIENLNWFSLFFQCCYVRWFLFEFRLLGRFQPIGSPWPRVIIVSFVTISIRLLCFDVLANINKVNSKIVCTTLRTIKHLLQYFLNFLCVVDQKLPLIYFCVSFDEQIGTFCQILLISGSKYIFINIFNNLWIGLGSRQYYRTKTNFNIKLSPRFRLFTYHFSDQKDQSWEKIFLTQLIFQKL